MAQDSRFHFNLSIEWITELPSASRSSFTSDTLWLQTSEWNLQISHNYTVTPFVGGGVPSVPLVSLVPKKAKGEGDTLQTPFFVETYLRHPTDFSRAPLWRSCKITKMESNKIWDLRLNQNEIYTLSSLKSQGKVRIVCLFYGVHPLTVDLLKKSEERFDLECLSNDLSRLLEGEQPDVRLNCGGQTFPAHRCVLAARSEVFAAMFRNKMSESETGGVDVKDFAPDVVRHFLQYLYTGTLAKEAGDISLLAIADKYAVDSLKMKCSRHMMRNLTEGNCVQFLYVAALHGSETLKKAAIDFICIHPTVMMGEEWEALAMTRPALTLEVHHSFVQYKTTKV